MIYVKDTRDFYNKTAVEWANNWYDNNIMLPYLKEFISYLPPKPNVLDLCCGAGYESMRMHNLGAKVTGLDFSENSIDIAKERNPDIKFIVEDMLNDYSYIGRFDGCAVIAGLVHCPNDKLKQVFNIIYKILNYNGVLFLVVKDGIGKNLKSSYKSIDGEDYDRAFYLHSCGELKTYSSEKFEFVKEADIVGQPLWKYYILRKKE